MAQHVTQPVSGHGLHDQSGQQVVGVRVVVVGAGRADQVVGQGEPDETPRRPHVPEIPRQVGREDAGVVVELVETAGVVEQLADGDPRRAAHETGQVAAHGGRESTRCFATSCRTAVET